MKKSILDFGSALSKKEQQNIQGGAWDNYGEEYYCNDFDTNCGPGLVCNYATGECVYQGEGGDPNGPGGGGICPENVGMNCNSPT